ncbi:hypothetical protein FIBSPDRAFT_952144 [Athelia psychrophila]|uniref:DUF6533 domain-containing protein n=1 Tax=Athelia psychrophila TaxID=1759441 RepID=A0A166LV12_9AGAM|nr:hypothetical protein FIBSPDRAFT_952144 [Fibularhizoctonia sp. CBS 109695]
MDSTRHSDSINVTPATLAVVQVLQHTRGAAYITFCALTVAAWDWTLALGEEVRMVKRCGRSHAVLAYFLARTSVVIGCISALVFFIKVPPDEKWCLVLFNWMGVVYTTGSAAKAYLFLLRVRAIHDNSKLVTLFSSAGWLVMVCARMTIAFTIDASAGRCAVTEMGSLSAFSLWLNLAYDTCIFLSVSVRLASHTKLTGTPWIASFVRGYGLPPTMRHLLHDGQIYYSITILFTLLAAVVAVSPVHPIYQGIFSIPAFTIETLMTCKIFRAMILRSLHPIQDDNLPMAPAEARTTAISIFELDTVLELRIRTTSTGREQVE